MRTEYFDVEGMPISLGYMRGASSYCMAWDTDPPRPFDPGSAHRNGARISAFEFLRLVVQVAHAETLRKAGQG